MELIASLDLLAGRVVRLSRGDFASVRDYGEPEEVLDRLELPAGSRLHVVDLEASKQGSLVETALVRRLAARDLDIQVGGGVRTLDDARRWLDNGAARVVVGTLAASSPHLLASLVDALGPDRIVPAVDVDGETIRVDGWTRASTSSLAAVFEHIHALGLAEALVTDIGRDGMLRGPAFDLYRRLARLTPVRIVASGGVTSVNDLVSLARISNVSGAVVGRALLDRRFAFLAGRARIATAQSIPERVIPCLDVRDGRVVKGVSFRNLRDAGDPVACARRYEEEGADELVLLDVSATDRDAGTAIDTVRLVAASLFIPLTVGGGVRSRDDFRRLLQAGADRVAVNTAALRRPELIAECAGEFGIQAVVVSCDARRNGNGWYAAIRSGRETTGVDAVAWCARAAELGAGEILLTSVDNDGTGRGYDIDLLRAVASSLPVGVIASGGAGRPEHFREAIETGGARAVLAATLFHDRVVGIGALKRELAACGIPMR